MGVEQLARMLADVLNNSPMSTEEINKLQKAEIQLMGDQVNIVMPDGSFAITVRKFGG